VDEFDASEPPRRRAVRGRVLSVPAAAQTPWLHGKVITSYDVMQKTVAAIVDDELAEQQSIQRRSTPHPV
jgi:hypothetical protein